MSALVITLIAILLAAALAGAALYYGGTSTAESANKAQAARLVNEGMQVRAGAEMHRAQRGTSPNSLQALVDASYLQGAITQGAWASTVEGYATNDGVSNEQCELANFAMGIRGIPACDDPRVANSMVCCTMPAPSAPPAAP